MVVVQRSKEEKGRVFFFEIKIKIRTIKTIKTNRIEQNQIHSFYW
jgi:hypothetical protein